MECNSDCQTYKMKNTPRLDRLSALLEGVAPRVEVSRPEADACAIVGEASARQFLHLYLIAEGTVCLREAREKSRTVETPAIVVCRADAAHVLESVPAEAFRGLLCAKAYLDGPVGKLLFNEFAEPLAVSLAESDASLSHVIQLIASELQTPRCGQPALLDRAGDILFIGLLRHLIAHPKVGGGLFGGLADPRIARALVAMHTAPQSGWTLETLAAEAGMSRTSFANTFRDVMHQTPGKYLSKLRLAIAAQAVQSGRGLKKAASESGYLSPSALSRALSRARSPSLN
ncbi:MAG: AraC family transcriptional regulator [Gammaproteobacteria bacterium]|nr:AraC family transcriptional regulator [Gammaproteobacteria bacterium]MBU1416427.1 AraC family transcriptional regulator [Gammaproteobacteria bacterium]